MNQPSSIGEYREQLNRLATAMAVGHHQEVSGHLHPSSELFQVELFTSGNLDKRHDKLLDQVEQLLDVMDDIELEGAVKEFIQTVPLAAYDTGNSDSERFLVWLTSTRTLSAEARDVVTCLRSRIAVEELARSNRLGHIRFQELVSIAEELSAELGNRGELQLHLNPIRVPAVFVSGLYVEQTGTQPVQVLFFASGNEIRTAALNETGNIAIAALSELTPCSFDEWTRRVRQDDPTEALQTEQLRDLAIELSQMGLIAFA